jgi:LPS sulfotransferase NodH
MTTKFVLLSTQRSGSTWVIDMLNSHPHISAYSELFLENGRGTPTWGGAKDKVFWDTYLDEKRRTIGCSYTRELLFHYLDELYGPRDGVSAIGFKLMYGQAGAYPDLREYIISNEVRIIHLIRRNLLDIILSKEAAAARDIYHTRTSEEIQEVSIRLGVAKLLGRLKREEREIQKGGAKFSSSGSPYMEITYEDLVGDHSEFDRLLEFLEAEIGGQQLNSSLKRINTVSHEEIIANYEAVKHTLEGTKYIDLLR